MSAEPARFSDAELTTYLDGEADSVLASQINVALAEDEGLAARVAELSSGVDLLNDAFSLDHLSAPAYVAPASPKATRSGIMLPLTIAASFALGAVVMQAFQPKTDWVDIIASYQALYVTETLSRAVQAPALAENVFQTAQSALGVDLRAATEIPGLDFKRAQLLAIEGQTLIQMAYLDGAGRPFAFCAVRLDDGDQSLLSEMSHGLAAASWISDGVGFVLIGGDDTDAVTALSDSLRRAL